MAKYKPTRQEEQPLSEVIGGRRNFYQARMAEAFDNVYNSSDFGYIEQFEKSVLELSARVTQRLGKLEETLEQEETEAPKERTRVTRRKADRRPRLTLHQYIKARDEGMTNEEIKEKFRMDSTYQIGGFGRQYQRIRAGTKKSK